MRRILTAALASSLLALALPAAASAHHASRHDAAHRARAHRHHHHRHAHTVVFAPSAKPSGITGTGTPTTPSTEPVATRRLVRKRRSEDHAARRLDRLGQGDRNDRDRVWLASTRTRRAPGRTRTTTGPDTTRVTTTTAAVSSTATRSRAASRRAKEQLRHRSPRAGSQGPRGRAERQQRRRDLGEDRALRALLVREGSRTDGARRRRRAPCRSPADDPSRPGMFRPGRGLDH